MERRRQFEATAVDRDTVASVVDGQEYAKEEAFRWSFLKANGGKRDR